MFTGVGLVITNKERNKFYFQQKDETYWIPEYHLKYCFFGGGREKEENAYDTLKRELDEELEPIVAKIILEKSKEVFLNEFINIFGKKCKHFIFEAILSEEEFKEIIKFPIKEGKQGKIFLKDELIEEKFFIETWKILKDYFKLKEN